MFNTTDMNLRIKELCKSKGVTLQHIAEVMGVNRVSLSNSINGNPTIQTLEKIAAALGVDVIELFEQKRCDFTALIDNKGELRRFDNINDLETYLSEIRYEGKIPDHENIRGKEYFK